ncbi:MAG TPA: hypothetical protein VKA70_11205 [Blastocatellia bacterium]|nr:hypothetical protein [Blastocatellia bacterium]
MKSQARLRLAFQSLIALTLVALIASQTASQNQEITQAAPDQTDLLIVHEWGTFTSIAGKDGAGVEWRALGGASDLPSFVYAASENSPDRGLRHGRCLKCNLEARVRMETPVLYFYADRETDVSVKVEFPKGKITEWYPQARNVHGGIDWGRIKVMPGADVSLPVESANSHYYPARETEAAPVRVCGHEKWQVTRQHEKFLFYRGVGAFDLPLAAMIRGDRVVMKNTGDNLIPQFVLFENQYGRIGYRVHDAFGGEIALERPRLDSTIVALESELEMILVGSGLYEKEAKAMIKTWRDSWFEEGLRVFYILPRQTTDTILPIEIEPRPAGLTRVMVGRLEVITPETEATLRQQIARLPGTRSGIETTARAIIAKHGRFSEPILKGLLKSEKDRAIRTRIEKIMRSLAAEAG